MIISKLQGGLGNQMFQYAAARGFSGDKKKVYLDCTFLDRNNEDTEHFTARSFELHIFKNLRAAKLNLFRLLISNAVKSLSSLSQKSADKLLTTIKQNTSEFVDFRLHQNPPHVYFDGYFQSEKYFEKIRGEILNEFKFPTLDLTNHILRKRILETKNAVCVHVRRGDYIKSAITSNFHGILPLTYYSQAVNILRIRYTELSLFIFSDDMSWSKKEFLNLGVPIYFVDKNKGSDSWKDMALMASCKHHIIANSSFSWWGAWLSTNGGDVFAPSQWFNPSMVEFEIHNFVPETWNIIDYD